MLNKTRFVVLTNSFLWVHFLFKTLFPRQSAMKFDSEGKRKCTKWKIVFRYFRVYGILFLIEMIFVHLGRHYMC